jgi:hypothetical protein
MGVLDGSSVGTGIFVGGFGVFVGVTAVAVGLGVSVLQW